MTAPAFSIEDASMASRWAGQVASLGYRVVITPCYGHAEEVIEVYVPRARAPAFRVHRGGGAILVTDCVGLAMSFPTLADALLAMAPLPKGGRRTVLKGGSPWRRAGRSMSGALTLLASQRQG